jgi:LacI family transcriptional regulator
VLRIGIQLDLIGAYGREVLRGIMRYAHVVGEWEFVMPPMYSLGSREVVSPETVDGLVAMVHDGKLLGPFRKAGVAVVNVARTLDQETLATLGLASVLPDDRRIGEVAFEYFRDRGFRNVAFCGHPTAAWSVRRGAAFLAAAEAAGCNCQKVAMADEVPAGWVKELELPCAVLAANDRYAWHAADACRAAGVRVPEDVAILGVDNDVLLADMVQPPVSSVVPGASTVGFEAGRLLSKLMKGEAAPVLPLMVEPEGIITRRSTDVLAISDDMVAGAVRLIRQKGTGNLSVQDIANTLLVSRRSLERRFRAQLGRSLLDEIRRVRIERARRLLCDTGLDMAAITRQCGFSSHERFSTVFRQMMGCTPSEYRRRHRVDR